MCKWFFLFCLWPNKILCWWIKFFLPLHWQFYLMLYCMLPLVFVVVGGQFLIGLFSWLMLSGSFQLILPILIPWLMPSFFSLCCILHVLGRFGGALVVLVCWILVLGKNIRQLCFVPLVLNFRIRTNKYGESFRLFCILLLRLDVLRCNLKF